MHAVVAGVIRAGEPRSPVAVYEAALEVAQERGRLAEIDIAKAKVALEEAKVAAGVGDELFCAFERAYLHFCQTGDQREFDRLGKELDARATERARAAFADQPCPKCGSVKCDHAEAANAREERFEAAP